MTVVGFNRSVAEAVRKRRAAEGPILDPRDPMPSARELMSSIFTDMTGAQLLHRHRGAFYKHSYTHYRLADDEEIRGDIWEFLECARRDDGKGPVPYKPTRARVGDVFEALGAVAALDPTISPPAWLEDTGELAPATEFMPVANGLLHLPGRVLCEPQPTYFGLSASDVEFDPDAPGPTRWLLFLRDLFGDDHEAVATLQDWFGYCLSTDTRQQKILLVVGPKRSGKGTIARITIGVMGKNSVAAPTLSGLSTNFGIEPLIGKPLAIISDARLGSRSDQAAISERLLSISGEDSLTIDRKFRGAWTGKLPTRFMLLTNELPRITDASGALAGRFIVLNLERSFYGREDPGLTDSLLAELPGILNWSLDGYERMLRRGYFVQPASARETIEALETLGSPITAFIRERCRLGPGFSVDTVTLFQAWREWCVANGRKEPGTVQTFGRDLRAAFPTIQMRRLRDGGERVRSYEGVAIL